MCAGPKTYLNFRWPPSMIFRDACRSVQCNECWQVRTTKGRPSEQASRTLRKSTHLSQMQGSRRHTLQHTSVVLTTQITRRAMDAEDQAARARKATRNGKPPGWKSRLQVCKGFGPTSRDGDTCDAILWSGAIKVFCLMTWPSACSE